MTEEHEVVSYSFISSTEGTQVNQEPDILFPLAENRQVHEKDENCSNCDRKFNIIGLSVSKKQICNFCYRGVCQVCLPHKCYHSESKRKEKMCSACHHQLLVLSSDFNNKLNNFRLERAAMTKEVTLAIKEREILMKERKITEERLESVKKTLESMKGGNLDQLNHERLVNNEMNDKVEDLSSQSKESQEKLLLLQQKLSDKKRKLAKFKEKREEQKKSSQEIIREIEQLKFACSKLKVVKHDENCTEEEILEKIIFLNEEIQVIQEKLSEKNALNSEVFQILTELLSKINENEEILSDVNEKFQNLRSAPQTLTEQEKEILENLKNQIKQQDDLISITKAQAQHRNSRLSLRTSHISLRSSQHPGVPSLRYNISSDLLQSANSSQYSIIPADETLQEGQRRCQSCLLL